MTTTPARRLTLYTADATGATVTLEATPRRMYPARFMTMFQSATQTLSTWDRPAAYWRVLMHLTGKLDSAQFRLLPYSTITAETGLSAPSVERAMSQLKADNVIIHEARKNGQVNAMRLSRRLGSTSSAEKWNAAEAMAADPELIDARGR